MNPLERAAEEVLFWSQLETGRSMKSPSSKRTSTEINQRVEPAGIKPEEKGDPPSPPGRGGEDDILKGRDTRSLEIGIPNYIPDDEYCSNAVITAKYNIATFLPIFLFKMFSRVAYVYFLFQATLSWWSAISPYSGLGPTAGLVFVLAVAAVKEIIEDKKRHEADLRTNTSITHVLQPDGSFLKKEWQQVKVGDLVQVNDGDLLPADLLCLHTALPDQVCFIKTANLDGESNLKIKRPVTLVDEDTLGYLSERSMATEEEPPSPPLTSPATYRKKFMPVEWMASFQTFKAVVHVEQPSPNLQTICGYVECSQQSGHKFEENIVTPITMNEMLLRGCMLKNSGFILGMVLYTGKETRIQMNNRSVPFKLGSFDTYLNMQIILLLFLQFSICLGCAIAALVWRNDQGMPAYYLAYNIYSWDNNNENPVYFVLLNIITNWILYSFMIPISLFVSNEIVKFWQTFVYINQDKEMIDPATDESARSRNSNVIEDLGKINYVFSDKTGTLTSNEMRLRAIGIGGLTFGSKDRSLELRQDLQGRDALQFFDDTLATCMDFQKDSPSYSEDNSKYDYVTVCSKDRDGQESINYEKLGELMYEFFLSICVCHSLIVEGGSDHPAYQGPSPDEVALVDAARQLGFEFKQRSSKHVNLAFHGHRLKFEILNVLEFTSDRRKMSVVARGPDGIIRLFCKGADSAIIECLREYKFLPDGDDLMEKTNESLTDFACQGLRTLCVANKIITNEFWEAWDQKYQEAAASIEERDSKIASCAEEIETELNLLGITAIEDKLQEGVPETIEMLTDAGIKVFMITGDKQETAISIAISCNLIQDTHSLMVCNESTKEDAQKKLCKFLKDCDDSKYYTTNYLEPERRELVIDGLTLNQILGTEAERNFAELASNCSSVVVCRASPSQKSAIVEIMKSYQMFSHSKWYRNNEEIPRLAKMFNKALWKVWDGRILAIGDGANDVAMLQSADVGIGISGKEGRQAVNNSDFAISQFRFLSRLLLVHGQLSYYRLAHLIKYSFYKNISFALVFFYFQFYCGFSGQAIIDSMSATVYNVVLTSLPILILASVDKPTGISTLLSYPQLYNTSRALSSWNFWKAALLKSALTSALSFFVPYFSASSNGQLGTDGIFSLGKTVYIALLGIVGIEILLLSKSWTKIFVAAVLVSYLFMYVFFPLYGAILEAIPYPQSTYSGIPKVLYSCPAFWLQIILCYLIAFGVRFIDRAIKLRIYPDDYDILSEIKLINK